MDRIIAVLRRHRCDGFEIDPASRFRLDLLRHGYDDRGLEVAIYPPSGILYAHLERRRDLPDGYAVVTVREQTGRRSFSDVCPKGFAP